jgi:alpha-galactosidase
MDMKKILMVSVYVVLCVIIGHNKILAQKENTISSNKSPLDVIAGKMYDKPPLGWNSWDSYGMYPTEKAMIANVEVMAKKLKPFGYTYFVIDAGWNKVKDANGKITGMSMDQYGRYIPNKIAFPNGIKAVADRAHALGLKFGIHIMRGISREAYKKDLPILGTSFSTRGIADTTSLCRWNNDNYGIDMTKPGAQAFYDSYINLLIGWGVDFIKADDIAAYPAEIHAVRVAIDKTGKEVMFSLSPGGDAKIENIAAYNEADMLRITKDVWDNQLGLTRAFEAWKKWPSESGVKFWLDMDMIPFGHLCLQNADPNYLTSDNKKEGEKNVRGKERLDSFTKDQKYTFITLRALSASPLFMGGDLPTTDDFSFELITNKDVLACNQNGVIGKLVYDKDGIEIWKTQRKNNMDEGWLGIFNRNPQEKSVQLTVKEFGISNKSLSLFSIWQQKDLGNVTAAFQLNLNVNPNGVVFCRFRTL